jgi:hypothetical protein
VGSENQKTSQSGAIFSTVSPCMMHVRMHIHACVCARVCVCEEERQEGRWDQIDLGIMEWRIPVGRTETRRGVCVCASFYPNAHGFFTEKPYSAQDWIWCWHSFFSFWFCKRDKNLVFGFGNEIKGRPNLTTTCCSVLIGLLDYNKESSGVGPAISPVNRGAKNFYSTAGKQRVKKSQHRYPPPSPLDTTRAGKESVTKLFCASTQAPFCFRSGVGSSAPAYPNVNS